MDTLADTAVRLSVVDVTFIFPPTLRVPVVVLMVSGEDAFTFPVMVTGLSPQVTVPVPLLAVKLAKVVGNVNVAAGKVTLVLSVPLPKTRFEVGFIVIKPAVFTTGFVNVIKVRVLEAPTTRLPVVNVTTPVKVVEPVRLTLPTELISTLS